MTQGTNLENAKCDSPIHREDGCITELKGKVKLGDPVQWHGRKAGSCTNDAVFIPGQLYRVCFIYPSNHDVEIERYIDKVHTTVRAGPSEYSVNP